MNIVIRRTRKHTAVLAALSALVIGACSQEPVSIEEKILMGSFAAVNAAQAYDHVCQKDSLLAMKSSDTPMANLGANIQMLAYRIGWHIHERRPKDTAEEVAKRLRDFQKLIALKTEADLKKAGCEGEAAMAAKSSFELYTKNEPIVLDKMINDEVIRQGGTLAIEKIPAANVNELREMKLREGANPEQLESLPAAVGDAPPVDTSARAYPAWGAWVKNQLVFSNPLFKKDEDAQE